MEKEIIITNRNRDGAKVWFENVEDNIYTIHTDDKHKYILEYACVNYDSLPEDAEDYDEIYHLNNLVEGERVVKAKLHSYDPAGGPYMAVGAKIAGHTLSRIFVKNNEGPMLFELN